MRLVHSLVWEEPPSKTRPLLESLAFTGVLCGVWADVAFTWWLRDETWPSLLLGVLTVAPLAGLWLLVSLHLPHRDAPWQALLPGALLVAIGFQVLHEVVVIYLVPSSRSRRRCTAASAPRPRSSSSSTSSRRSSSPRHPQQLAPRRAPRRPKGGPDMTTKVQDDRRVPTKARVEHPTVAERVAAGQAARAEVPRSAQAEFDPARPAGPGRPAREPGGDPRARAGADPLRAHAGLALHLLPRRRPDHGQRPRHTPPPACTPSSAATPTCPTSASSAPPSGAWTSTSTTSTRPCRAPSSGTSSAWRPASRWPAATGALAPPTAKGRCGPARPATAAPWPALPARATWRPSTRAWTSTRPCPLPGHRLAQDAQAGRKTAGQGAHQGQHAGAGQAHPPGGRGAAHQRRPAPDRADRRPLARRPGHPVLGLGARAPERVPAHPVHRPPPAARALPLRRPGAQGGGGGQRGHARLDRPDARPRRAGPLFLQVKEAEDSVWRSSPGAASTATPATAWSPASG